MSSGRWTRWLVVCQAALLLALGVGVFALRYSLLSWRPALLALAVASLLMGVIGFFSLLYLYLQFRQGNHDGAGHCVKAVALSLLPLAALLVLGVKSRGVPPIHDISTDTVNPPAFTVLAAARKPEQNSVQYPGGEVAAQQEAAYPQVKPYLSGAAVPMVYAACLETAKRLGWEVVAQDPDAGRIEAVATTAVFRFQDDVVVRVTATDAGSRVDVRSASRVGVSDFGANAKRIQEFLAAVRTQVES